MNFLKFCIFIVFATSFSYGTVVADTTSLVTEIPDSVVLSEKTASVLDTVTIKNQTDTIFKPNLNSATFNQEKKTRVVKRKFTYKNQIGTALGMMVFLTIILTLGQNLNPQ